MKKRGVLMFRGWSCSVHLKIGCSGTDGEFERQRKTEKEADWYNNENTEIREVQIAGGTQTERNST